jgi:hypothetical protein
MDSFLIISIKDNSFVEIKIEVEVEVGVRIEVFPVIFYIWVDI